MGDVYSTCIKKFIVKVFMASTPTTLNSRLRVLIAKSFRAEKLYASMKNDRGALLPDTGKVIDFANTIRAEVWQQTHCQLRKALNEIVLLGSSTAILKSLVELYNEMLSLIEKHNVSISELTVRLKEDSARHEFVHCLKLSVDLIRCKSFIQVNQLIADELHEIIRHSRKGEVVFSESPELEELQSGEDFLGVADNVIPFKRKAVNSKER
ncbi:MAG: hypothetical protein IT292_12380 [Deltaproteobacteria bacterium]|nr:hypothetical protein [Deltaproteobacteria bacterium]